MVADRAQSINIQIVMQKSMVHELNTLTYSNIFSSRPSYISTHITDPNINELRSSRIKNLPGYKKDDLSNKINFVVVFQTIEIQRLSFEVETLRVRLKDLQRQIFNGENYEVQIRELTERCHVFELQREGLQQQAQKMRVFCEKLYHQFEEYKSKYGEDAGLREKYTLQKKRSEQLQGEIDKWRNRFNGLERAKGKQLQEMRTQMQSQRKSSLNRQMKELTIKYENDISNVLSEMRKVREENEWRVSQVIRLEGALSEFNLREQEIRQMEDKVDEYENKFVMLSQENYRLNELLRWKVEELNRFKLSDKELRVRLEGIQQLEESNRQMTVEISRLGKEVQEQRVSDSRVAEQISRLSMQNKKLGEYEKQTEKSNSQIQRLNGMMNSKMMELDENKNKVKILQTKLNAVNNATQKEFASYEEKMVGFSQEHERLNAVLKSRLGESEGYKKKIAELEQQITKADTLERQNFNLREQINVAARRLEESKLKIIIFEEHENQMDDLQRKLNKKQKVNDELLEQRERLNQTIKSLTLQLQTSSSKLSVLQGQHNKYANLQFQIKEYQTKLSFMTQLIDKLQTQIGQKINELHQLRETLKALADAKNIYNNIEDKLVENLKQMEQLILDLDEKGRENQRLVNTNMGLQMAVKKLQDEVIGVDQEKEHIIVILEEKNREIKKLQQQVEGLSGKVAENRELQAQSQQFQTKIEVLKNSCQQLETRYRNQTRKSQQFSIEVERLNAEILQLRQTPKIPIKLGQQLTILRKQSEQKGTMIAYLKKRIQTIENILRVLKQKYVMQWQVCEDLFRKIESVGGKMILMEEICGLVRRYAEELERINEENIILESQNKILDLELCESVKVSRETENKPMGGTFAPSPTFKSESPSYKSGSPTYNKEYKVNNIPSFVEPLNSNLFTYQNESISDKVPFFVEPLNSNLLTFKDMGSTRTVELPFKPLTLYSTQRVERGDEGSQSQSGRLGSPRETSSMAGSFINTLISNESVGRFENVGVSQIQSLNNPNVNRTITVSKMQYVPTSPTNGNTRPNSSFYSPPIQRNNEIRYYNQQIEQQPKSPTYLNPFNQISNHNEQSVEFENAGVKRVSSYTHFVSYTGGQSYVPQEPIEPSKDREPPTVKYYEPIHSPMVTGAKTASQYGKPIRLSSDSPKVYPSYYRE